MILKLVSLLGKSPGTPHTTLCKLVENNAALERHIIIATREASIEEAVKILQNCPCPAGKPRARIEVVTLPFSDITSVDELNRLRETLAKMLDTNTILDITGGRKLMAVAAALEALNKGATIVATIIPQEEYIKIASAVSLCEKTRPEKSKLITLI